MLSAIIPAYNEERTIGQIVATLKKAPLIKEVVVVDDGSEDETARRALGKGAQVVRLPKNQGKGEALKIGVERARGDILLFLDGDLIGLTQEHIELLAVPVIRRHLDITIGSVDRGRRLNRWLRKFESPFSGLRALKRDFWEEIPDDFKKGYFIESALTYFAKQKRLKTHGFVLKGLKHIVKEKKHGFWQGLGHRFKMMAEIVLANFLLRFRS